MISASDLKDKDVLILCGGLGKRLRSKVQDAQKVMAKVSERPFLDILLDYLAQQGFKRIILCTGYKADTVEQYYHHKKTNLLIEFSKENEPLGTGGAIKNAAPLVHSDRFFILNGDCFCALDYARLLSFHKEKKAIASLVLCRVQERKDFGSVMLGESDAIIDFLEKISESSTPYISAGIYCFNKNIFNLMPEKNQFSIEKEFFPLLVGKGFFGFKAGQEFIDIGTPERYERAESFIKKG